MKSRLLLSLLAATALPAWSEPSELPTAPGREPIRPIPLEANLDARKVALGQALFHEPQLSHDNTISCATCHDLAKGGTDQRQFALGINQAAGTLNVPTVYNSARNFRLFWDGRDGTLEAQIDGPLLEKDEMGSTWDEVLGKLRALPRYTGAFAKIYPDGIQSRNVKDAITEFERSLSTPNSRFDKFLRGDGSALTADEKEGYRKFKSYGCTSCHQGVNVGGNLYEKMGAMADYFQDRGKVTRSDYGRFNVTGHEEDRFAFKVPTLRNVALTAPYLHDGSALTLEEVVAVMAKYQLGERLPPADLAQVVQFLKSLTGEYGGKPL